jgi:hypothetical protein
VTAPWRLVLDMLMVIHLVKKSPTFYRISKSITMFIISYSWFLSWARWIQFLLFCFFKNHLSLKTCLGLPICLFCSSFFIQILCAFSSVPCVLHVTSIKSLILSP